MNGELRGKVALITGAAQGLGRGIALELAAAGAEAIVNDLPDNPRAQQTVAELRKYGVRAAYIGADVTDESAVQTMYQRVREEFGRLDILVNNAGTTKPQDIFATSLEDWKQVIDTNLTSMFLCSKYAMPLLKESGAGRIINISSVVAHRGALLGHVHYAATKSGALGFTKTLARTAAPLGITVNAIAPGIIATDLLYATHGQDGVAELAATVPLGLGQPEDIGQAAVFLAGAGARYITGATIDVNGGMYLR